MKYETYLIEILYCFWESFIIFYPLCTLSRVIWRRMHNTRVTTGPINTVDFRNIHTHHLLQHSQGSSLEMGNSWPQKWSAVRIKKFHIKKSQRKIAASNWKKATFHLWSTAQPACTTRMQLFTEIFGRANRQVKSATNGNFIVTDGR